MIACQLSTFSSNHLQLFSTFLDFWYAFRAYSIRSRITWMYSSHRALPRLPTLARHSIYLLDFCVPRKDHCRRCQNPREWLPTLTGSRRQTCFGCLGSFSLLTSVFELGRQGELAQDWLQRRPTRRWTLLHIRRSP